MQPPSLAANSNSSSLVLLEVNMMSSGLAPNWRAWISSGIELQSKPNPISFMSFRISRLGSAFTAKNSRKPGIPENAFTRLAPVSLMPASS